MNPLFYQPRKCQFLRNQTVADCCYKLYTIFADPARACNMPSGDQIYQWLDIGNQNWQSAADHGVGFAIVHFGVDGDYLLLSRWYDANMIRHRVFALSDDQGPVSLPDNSIIACVWELKLIMAERDAWLAYVLTADDSIPAETRIHEYLQYFYQGEV